MPLLWTVDIVSSLVCLMMGLYCCRITQISCWGCTSVLKAVLGSHLRQPPLVEGVTVAGLRCKCGT